MWQPEIVRTSEAALRAAASLGPYFSVDLAAVGPGWLALGRLVEDPALLRDRVATTRALLAEPRALVPGDVDQRAAASIWFLGLGARLVSPALGSAVLTGMVPDVALGSTHWQAVDGGPIPIAVTGSRPHPASTPDGLAGLLFEHVIAPAVTPVATAVGHEFRLSPKVVWGNVASAIAGAATMLGLTRPDLAARSRLVAEHLLAHDPLAGAGGYVKAGGGHERAFVRNNCCLFYRIPGGGTCADCVLGPLAARRARRGVAADLA